MVRCASPRLEPLSGWYPNLVRLTGTDTTPAKQTGIPYNVYSSDDLPKLKKYLISLAQESICEIHIYTRSQVLSSKLNVRVTRG